MSSSRQNVAGSPVVPSSLSPVVTGSAVVVTGAPVVVGVEGSMPPVMPVVAGSVVLVASVVMLTGCKKSAQPDIPAYPGSQGFKGMGKIEKGKVAVFNNNWVTPSNVASVRTFYEGELLKRPNWTQNGDYFTDGNMLEAGGEMYWPKDETKPAGMVSIMTASDRTMITIWQAIPQP